MKNLIMYKDMKGLKTKLIAGALAFTMTVGITGCGKKDKVDITSDQTVSYVQDDLNNEIKDFQEAIMGKVNLTDEEARNSYIVMNVDSIIKKNSQLLPQIFANGESADKFIQDYTHYLSLIREYNTNVENSSDYLSVYYGNNATDKKIIEKLEIYAKNSVNGKNKESNFDNVEAFCNGEGVFELDGEKYSVSDLSIGGGMAYIIPAQVVSVLSQNDVALDRRQKLDVKLNNSVNTSVQRLTELLNLYATSTDKFLEQTVDDYVSEITEEGQKQVAEFEENVKTVKSDLDNKNISVSDEEIYCAQIIANLDYLQSNEVEAAVFVTIVGNRTPDKIIASMQSFVSKVQSENKGTDLYTYEDLFVKKNEDNMKDRIGVVGMVKLVNSLQSQISIDDTEETLLDNDFYRSFKGFHQYNSEASFEYNDYKVVKNDLDAGTVLIVNEISSYYTGKIIKKENDITKLYDYETGDATLTGKNDVWEMLNAACEYRVANSNQKVLK